MSRFVRPGQRVLIKVNLLRASQPDQAIVTHPEVVRAVGLLARDAGGRVVIADSPSGRLSTGTLRRAYRASGLQTVADETGLALNTDTEVTTLSYPDGVTAKRFEVCRYLTQADVVISLPKLKTHSFARFTGAVKNLFGVVPGLQKTSSCPRCHCSRCRTYVSSGTPGKDYQPHSRVSGRLRTEGEGTEGYDKEIDSEPSRARGVSWRLARFFGDKATSASRRCSPLLRRSPRPKKTQCFQGILSG